MPNSLLYIGCPPTERRLTETLLRSAGFSTHWVEDAAAAVEALDQGERVVLADFADGRAHHIVREIRRRRPATFLLAITDPTRAGAQEEIESAGISVVLNRPLDTRLLSLLSTGPGASEHGRHEASEPEGPPIFAYSPAMCAALQALERAVAAGGGVLVCGEPGTGRQMVAREIHRRSAGPDAPFVRVDSATLSGEQLEVALFGTVDNGRNGSADRQRAERIGRHSALAAARGGTIFLAHLADAPARVQSRLARVLRDGEVTVGENRHATIDVRPIASADATWDAAVAEGRIRPDLAKRVSTTRVEVPALRSRREDIPHLAAFVLEAVCAALGVPLKTIEPPALALLTALPWRQNGRELRSLLETLAQHVPGPSLRLEDLLGVVSLDGDPRPLLAGPLREARARFEREYITAVLEHHRGRVGEAARALGIQRTNLYRKMRALKISRRPAGAFVPAPGRGPGADKTP